MRRLLVFLIVAAALVFVVLPYFVLPAVLENFVARDVQNRLGLAEAPTVNLDSDPQWEMLRGEFSEGRITVEDFDLGVLRFESAAIDMDGPFSINVPQSLRNGVVVPEDRLSGRLRLEVSEAEVSRLARTNAGVPIKGIDLRRDGVTVESETTALGTSIPVTVDGVVGVEGGSLNFTPQTVEAAGVTIPGWIADGILSGAAFSYPVSGLPYGSDITGARTTDSTVVITGRVPSVDLGALPTG